MADPAIAGIEVSVVGVSAKSNWIFVEIHTADGRTGLGEATLHGLEPLVVAWLHRAEAELTGLPLSQLPQYFDPGRTTRAGLAGHAAISALEQARADITAQTAGCPVAGLFSDVAPVGIDLYANLNRGLADRSPEGFVERAMMAVRAGYAAVKIAPFDGLTTRGGDGAAREARVSEGLARIHAVREAIGWKRTLLLDCHWRFEHERAARLIEEVAEDRVGWLECPLPETPANLGALADLRRRANAAGMALAGAELLIGVAGFQPFLDIYDTVMPDVKYCGGPFELARIAEAALERGVRVAPHNPSGPVAHAHSVHLGAHPAIHLLEAQFRERSLFDSVVRGASPRFSDGVARASTSSGLGLSLDKTVCASHRQELVPLPRT